MDRWYCYNSYMVAVCDVDLKQFIRIEQDEQQYIGRYLDVINNRQLAISYYAVVVPAVTGNNITEGIRFVRYL